MGRVLACQCVSAKVLKIVLNINTLASDYGDHIFIMDFVFPGRGGSDGCKIPMKVDSLQGLGVIKVECGSQFSVALTKSGAVYTWYVLLLVYGGFLFLILKSIRC